MNTLTIAVLLVCATMAYASAIPGGLALAQGAESQPAVPAEELLEGAESRRGGYGGYGHGGGGYGHGGGGYGHGGHHGGGRHGGYGRW